MNQRCDHGTNLLIDSHAHLHDCFPIDAFLNASLHNFSALEKKAKRHSGATVGVLMFADMPGQNSLKRIESQADTLSNNWQIVRTAETCSLGVNWRGKLRLIAVAGRQITTAAKLEVLALATSATYADGRPLHDIVEQVHSDGAIAVLPWGFGKWWFDRGARLDSFIENAASKLETERVFIGDSACRPRMFRRPPMFSTLR